MTLKTHIDSSKTAVEAQETETED